MSDVSDKTALVMDTGLFLPLARRLGKDFKRVLYAKPWEQAFPTINDCCIGDGFEEIEVCSDIWKVKDEVDVFIFPDIMNQGLQLELESQGFPVWGSRNGSSLEMNREKFHRVLGEVGLEVPKFERIIGITALREHLKDEADKFIKISKFRGSLETCKWRNWDVDEGMLDVLAVRFGGLKEQVPFMVFDKIETDIELGVDTFNVDGQWPDTMIHGYEAKDQAFIAAVRPTTEMPKQVTAVLEAFGPVLKEYRYRNSFSAEIRVAGDKFYFIDPCCRFPMPPTGSKCELWGNISEAIWAGARGGMEQPKETAKFSMECCLKLPMEKGEWGEIEVPDDLDQWMKLSNCVRVDGKTCFPPSEFREDNIGWLVATGDTLEETLSTILDRVKELPEGVSASTHTLAELLAQLKTAEEEGITLGSTSIPAPAKVMQDA